jgi:hypothetical protein
VVYFVQGLLEGEGEEGEELLGLVHNPHKVCKEIHRTLLSKEEE